MPKVYSEGDKSHDKVLRGSRGVGKVARGGSQVSAKTRYQKASMRVDYQGAPDSRPSSQDRTQSAK